MNVGPACPACCSPGPALFTRLALDGLDSAIFRCNRCSHRFLFTTEEQQRAIESTYHHHYVGYRHDPVFDGNVRAAIEADIRPRKAPPARVLDVGCGAGAFLRAARAAGYQAEGIDVSADAVDICRAAGVPATAGDFLAFEAPAFDVITMWDVVEHLRKPEAFFRHAHELLAPGGYLVLKIPGFGGLAFPPIRLYDRLATSILGAPGHVQYFNERSLTALLEHCGFEPQWLPSRGFRSKRRTRSLRRLVGRAFVAGLQRLSGSRNLYVAARKR